MMQHEWMRWNATNKKSFYSLKTLRDIEYDAFFRKTYPGNPIDYSGKHRRSMDKYINDRSRWYKKFKFKKN